jgi:hypothetical protein
MSHQNLPHVNNDNCSISSDDDFVRLEQPAPVAAAAAAGNILAQENEGNYNVDGTIGDENVAAQTVTNWKIAALEVFNMPTFWR